MALSTYSFLLLSFDSIKLGDFWFKEDMLIKVSHQLPRSCTCIFRCVLGARDNTKKLDHIKLVVSL